MRLLKNSSIPRESWYNFYRSELLSTPFQSPEYYDFVNSVPDFSAEVHAVEMNGQLRALCVTTIQKENGLKGYFSRRGIIYGGPILRENVSAELNLLLQAINNDLRDKVIYVETRNSNNYSQFKETFGSNGWSYQAELNYHLDCSSEETAWKNFSNSRKRQIRKALKAGVSIEPATDVTEVLEYYCILKNLYTTKIKKPLASPAYFERMFELNHAKFLLIKYRGKIIGGIIAPVQENKCIYELNICGLDKEYKEAYPSVMATFAAIEYGYKNGLKRFDFMGAGSPDDDYGVREFKSKFGGVEVENGRFLHIFNPALYNMGKIAINKLKWLST
jgi:hypothetical protein